MRNPWPKPKKWKKLPCPKRLGNWGLIGPNMTLTPSRAQIFETKIMKYEEHVGFYAIVQTPSAKHDVACESQVTCDVLFE